VTFYLPIENLDGARLTVTRRNGHGKPLDNNAALTRSRDSRTAASGRPTMVKAGRPLDTWTSTETGRPTAPARVADEMAASTEGNGRSRPEWRTSCWVVSVRSNLLTSLVLENPNKDRKICGRRSNQSRNEHACPHGRMALSLDLLKNHRSQHASDDIWRSSLLFGRLAKCTP
jgi:hypothetical protein